MVLINEQVAMLKYKTEQKVRRIEEIFEAQKEILESVKLSDLSNKSILQLVDLADLVNDGLHEVRK